MKPLYENAQSELISAMSCMNTHDTRKVYDGTFLSDNIQNVACAMEEVKKAFDIYDDDVYDDVYILHCQNAIDLLKDDYEDESLIVTHDLLNHAVEHIEAAITAAKKGDDNV